MVDERKQNSISYSSQVIFCGFQVALLVESESTGLKSVAASLAALQHETVLWIVEDTAKKSVKIETRYCSAGVCA